MDSLAPCAACNTMPSREVGEQKDGRTIRYRLCGQCIELAKVNKAVVEEKGDLLLMMQRTLDYLKIMAANRPKQPPETTPPEDHANGSRRRPARQSTREAIRQVDERANEEWKAVADQCARTVAERERIVTSEMVRHELEKHPYANTHQLRAIGPVMLRAQKSGWIKATPYFSRCKDDTQHATPHLVWLSRICEQRQEPSPTRLVRISDEAVSALRLLGFETGEDSRSGL